ncbi:RNA polymerase sigma factor, sigma-70 family [Zhouia amylolytica]|uniref:RNA polymerase ECF-type sigma factor n=2 Tax=Zhouia amylolytica TaxID=376730 RepID=W2UIB2_9FLAO|nr:sigma-70 family RNA polymerase sigma factor [Zhouia amylolytica]ETN93895.1 hypothetical protein P278_33050 [Zhouia amylolytica AD3]MCQ0112895.1 sigma-70 family RNA polymerase sigma factor [Zhouia amylolytica]SFS33073.1 RNA polymerase sigma factor, sigma-70 family [Zhouia amylolytica]
MKVLKLSYNKQKDIDLWTDMKFGDKGAFNQIFEEHVHYLTNYGKTFTADWDLVDDCIQEVFCRIWILRKELKTTDNIRFYLMASFRNELMKSLQKRKKFNLIASWSELDAKAATFDMSAENLMFLENNDGRLSQKIKEIFIKLTSRQKEIIYLKYYNELSFEEISQVMQISKKAVYNALSKAMMTLRKGVSK